MSVAGDEQDGARRRARAAGPRRAAQQEAQARGLRGGAPPVPLHRRRSLLRARALLRRLLRVRQRRGAGGTPRGAARVAPAGPVRGRVRRANIFFPVDGMRRAGL